MGIQIHYKKLSLIIHFVSVVWLLPMVAKSDEKSIYEQNLLEKFPFLEAPQRVHGILNDTYNKGIFTTIEHAYVGNTQDNLASKIIRYSWLFLLVCYAFALLKNYEQPNASTIEDRKVSAGLILLHTIFVLPFAWMTDREQSYFFLTDTGLLIIKDHDVPYFFRYDTLVGIKVIKTRGGEFGRIINTEGKCFDLGDDLFASESGFENFFARLKKKVDKQRKAMKRV